MKHQFAFGWYALLAIISTMNLILIYSRRPATGAPDWWMPLIFMAFLAYSLTRCTATAKKDWSR